MISLISPIWRYYPLFYNVTTPTPPFFFRFRFVLLDSGFKHVAPATYHPRLLQLKGKKNVVASEVKICIDSLNDGDSFIYDAGLAVYGYLVLLVIIFIIII